MEEEWDEVTPVNDLDLENISEKDFPSSSVPGQIDIFLPCTRSGHSDSRASRSTDIRSANETSLIDREKTKIRNWLILMLYQIQLLLSSFSFVHLFKSIHAWSDLQVNCVFPIRDS